jgi:integrase
VYNLTHSKCWVWYYRYVDADSVKREAKGCTDKRATEELARAAESEAAKVRAGLIDPKEDAYRKADTKPIGKHLDDFHSHLTAKGDTPKHAHMIRAHVARIVGQARIDRISGLSPSSVQSALKTLHDGGRSLQTCNHALRAVKSFSRWLRKDGRAREDALADMGGFNVATDRCHERRAFTDEELVRLVRAAEGGPVILGMTGPDRAMLYRGAVGTGLRANELRSLTPESFHLDGDHPRLILRPADEKARRGAEQPISRTLADALRPWLAGKAPGCPVFALPEKTARMLREDLEAARIAYRDDSGRVLDFHALRHTYVTLLARSGAPVKVVQTLARHSDPKLTLNTYTHLTVFDTAPALDALPDLAGPAPGTEAASLAATGTDGGHISGVFAHHLPTAGDGSGRDEADSGGINKTTPDIGGCRNSLEMSGLDASGRELTGVDGNTPERIRTSNLRFRRPMLYPIELRVQRGGLTTR